MTNRNKTILQQMFADYTTYCNKQTDCDHCKLYDCDVSCETAFGVLSGLGKIKMEFDDSEV